MRAFGRAASDDFNIFDAALCEGREGAALRVLPTVARRVLEALFLAAAGFAEDLALDVGLGDFLRDFLDIRLPFDAFGGSIIGLLRVPSGRPDSVRRLGKSDGAGIWLQGNRCPACILVE
jgi:hypothetical protein